MASFQAPEKCKGCTWPVSRKSWGTSLQVPRGRLEKGVSSSGNHGVLIASWNSWGAWLSSWTSLEDGTSTIQSGGLRHSQGTSGVVVSVQGPQVVGSPPLPSQSSGCHESKGPQGGWSVSKDHKRVGLPTAHHRGVSVVQGTLEASSVSSGCAGPPGQPLTNTLGAAPRTGWRQQAGTELAKGLCVFWGRPPHGHVLCSQGKPPSMGGPCLCTEASAVHSGRLDLSPGPGPLLPPRGGSYVGGLPSKGGSLWPLGWSLCFGRARSSEPLSPWPSLCS